MNVWVLISFSKVNCVVPNFILERLDFALRSMRSDSTYAGLAIVYCLFTRRNYNNSHVNVAVLLPSVHRNVSGTGKLILLRSLLHTMTPYSLRSGFFANPTVLK